MLTPKTSIIRKLYESHARPFTRFVHGIPESWGSNTAAAVCPFEIGLAVWSSCNRFIAVSPEHSMTVDVLDSATLQRLQSFSFSSGGSADPDSLVFSPDSRMVTCFGYRISELEAFVVSWDLQTGCIVSAIERRISDGYFRGSAGITYSTNGKIVAVLFWDGSCAVISIYDVAAGVFMHDVYYSIGDALRPQGGIPILFDIWAHGDTLRFATPGSETTINILEVELAPGARPITVETHFVPGIDQRSAFELDTDGPPIYTRFFPTPSRLALICAESLRVAACGARDSEFLLCNTEDIAFFPDLTFSSDGRFFACQTALSVYLWMESPTGYILRGKLASGPRCPRPLLSPNGESIVTLHGPMIRLWPTKTIATPTAGISTGPPCRRNFILEFHPNMPLGIVVRQRDNVVTVLNLNSGVPQLTINTGMEVYGLGVTDGTVVVIGSEQVVTWNLPGGSTRTGAITDIEGSTQTMKLGNINWDKAVVAASISLDSGYVAFIVEIAAGDRHLLIYELSTLRCLSDSYAMWKMLWFSQDGRNIFCVADGNEGEVVSLRT